MFLLLALPQVPAARNRRLGAIAGRLGAEMGRSVPISPSAVSAERNYFENSAIRYDERGRLWVRTERAPSGRTIFDVFTPNGTFLGEVVVTAAVREFALGAGVLTGVVRDELEIQRIAVWQIR